MIQRGLDRAKLLDQFNGAFIANAGGAGNVIDAVAAQRHDIDDARRRHAEYFFHLCRIENQVIFGRIQDGHISFTSCIMSLSLDTM